MQKYVYFCGDFVIDLIAGWGNWCEVDTKELRQLIDEWCDKVQKFKMRSRKTRNKRNLINGDCTHVVCFDIF